MEETEQVPFAVVHCLVSGYCGVYGIQGLGLGEFMVNFSSRFYSSVEVLGVWGDFARGFRGLEAQSFTVFRVSVVFGFAPLATLAVLGLSLRCHYGAG